MSSRRAVSTTSSSRWVDKAIASHGGRIVKTTGDGLLLEFPSVVNAVRCAVEVQTATADRTASIDEDRRIAFRVGINLGDIIVETGHCRTTAARRFRPFATTVIERKGRP